MAEATVPVTVADDAAARVAELGYQRELEQMLEHVRRTTPGLRAINVTLEHDPACAHNDPQVVIEVNRDDLADPTVLDETWLDWARWQAATFPPQVFQHFVRTLSYGVARGW